MGKFRRERNERESGIQWGCEWSLEQSTWFDRHRKEISPMKYSSVIASSWYLILTMLPACKFLSNREGKKPLTLDVMVTAEPAAWVKWSRAIPGRQTDKNPTARTWGREDWDESKCRRKDDHILHPLSLSSSSLSCYTWVNTGERKAIERKRDASHNCLRVGNSYSEKHINI